MGHHRIRRALRAERRRGSAAWRWVHRLALSPERVAALDGHAMSPSVAALLPSRDGWAEVGSEMPVLSHENLFGLRRIFRLAQRDDEIALFSQLLAIDTAGQVRLTSVAGEIEALTMGPAGAIAARVWELDRRAVRCETGIPLAEVDVLAHVPSMGADGFLEVFDPPARVEDLPCFSCHHDTSLQSLPDAALDPGWRWAALIEHAEGRLARSRPAGR